MKTANPVSKIVKDYTLLTVASILIVISTWLFKYPNNFTFGGITGLSIVLSKLISIPASTLNLGMNIILLVICFITIGKSFVGKTIYVTLV